jgi:hypothetical protein
MKAYRTYSVVEQSGDVVLRDIPFRPGEQIEVLLIGTEDNKKVANEFRMLAAKTQQLPQIQTLTESEILAEIKVYKQGR